MSELPKRNTNHGGKKPSPKPKTNPMRSIRVEKVTLNIGAGRDNKVLERGVKLLKHITGITPVKTITQKRIANWGLRPGLPIGVKITLRGPVAAALTKRLLVAKNNTLRPKNLDENGNISFGVNEYIDIPDVKYDPDIGMQGLQASITLARPGFRIKSRKLRKARVPHHHRINRSEAADFLDASFKTKVEQ